MTLTSGIIQAAYRESNIIMAGASPTDTQTAEALARLNSIVSAALGHEIGRDIFDWPVGQEGVTTLDETYWSASEWAYPPANVRLIAASADAQTIYFHPQPSDGARMTLIDPGARLAAAPITVDGNGRTIENAATQTVSVDNSNKVWLYRGDLGDWKLLSTLTAVDPEDFPFPIEFDDYFITMLAARVNPRYGRALSELTVMALESSLTKLRARYRQAVSVSSDLGDMALAQQYGSGRFRSAQDGDRGSHFTRRAIRPPHYEG